MSALRALGVRLGLVAAGVLVAVLVLELGCRLLVRPGSPTPPALETIDEGMRMVGHEQFNEYHPLLGMNGIPRLHTTAFGGLVVTHNGRGNRNHPVTFSKPEGVHRVVLLGDSNAWGYGVGDDQTLGAQLEAALAAEAPAGRWEVANLAVTGYGPDQQYLKLLLEGVRYRPDVVAVMYFDLNDVMEAMSPAMWGVEKPRFTLHGERLCLENVPPKVALGWPNHSVERLLPSLEGGDSLFRRVADASAIVAFLRTRTLRPELAEAWNGRSVLALARRQGMPSAMQRTLAGHLGCPADGAPAEGSGRRLVVAILRSLRAVAEGAGARFVVLTTPTAGNYKDGVRGEQYDEIVAGLAAAGVATIDLERMAREAGMPPEALYLNRATDDHFSVAGHRAAAAALAHLVAR